jgi:hypothetical protein
MDYELEQNIELDLKNITRTRRIEKNNKTYRIRIDQNPYRILLEVTLITIL